MQLFFTPLSQALRLVMHLGEPLPEERIQNTEFNTGTLLLFYLLPYAMMMWTNGVGASTGMFVPALAVGATGAPLPQPRQPGMTPAVDFNLSKLNEGRGFGLSDGQVSASLKVNSLQDRQQSMMLERGATIWGLW